MTGDFLNVCGLLEYLQLFVTAHQDFTQRPEIVTVTKISLNQYGQWKASKGDCSRNILPIPRQLQVKKLFCPD